MKLMYVCAAALGAYLSGCTAMEDGAGTGDEGQATSAVSRPPLSSICGSLCNNSHNVRSCLDQRTSGIVNVSVFPLIEGATFRPAAILGTSTSWLNTSCPNCQWHLVSITNDRNGGVVTTGIAQAADDVNLQRTVNGQSDMSYHVNIEIADPTDASVGVCDLSVGIELVTGVIQ
jgi:hypothetical protein